jgi:hypothetical protein
VSESFRLPETAGMSESTNESKLSSLTELAKALAWPILCLFVVFSFWSPLHKAANAVASVLVASEAITIGELTIKIGKAGIRPSPEVRDILKDLSADTIKQLTGMNPSRLYPSPQNPTSKSLDDKLISLKLVKELSPDELAGSSKQFPTGFKFVYGIALTPLGEEVKSYVLNVMTEVIRETGSPDAEG